MLAYAIHTDKGMFVVAANNLPEAETLVNNPTKGLFPSHKIQSSSLIGNARFDYKNPRVLHYYIVTHDKARLAAP